MNAHARWHRVEQLCQAALDLDASEREAFLTAECGSDAALLREVQAVMTHVPTGEHSLEQPIAPGGVRRWTHSVASMTGQRLAHYLVGAKLGAGGMGVVYRAEDTKLKRAVALKFLAPDLTRDEHARRRLIHEAQMLAAFSHPHIAAIYGLEEIDGHTLLVLELIEGETLAARIGRGRLSMPEALPIARQIAEALEAAHDRGIVHHDLKPSNIALTLEGTVKVLDFGIARSVRLDPESPQSGESTSVIVGTPSYMSPEQLRGHPADKRSDLWALGCVVYEMLTGKRAFDQRIRDGPRTPAHEEPDWGALPADTPPSLRRVLRRCLATDHARRLADAADARLEIEDGLMPSLDDAPPLSPSTGSQLARVTAVGAVVVVLALSAVTPWWRGAGRDSIPVYASIDVPSNYMLGDDDPLASLPSRTPMVFTRDGRALILQAARDGQSQLFLRPLDRSESRPIAGTEGAQIPFVSPDGKWIGFWSANEMRRVPIEGGDPITICPTEAPRSGPYGASWGAGDVIVFGDYDSGRLMRVSAHGGSPVPITEVPPQDRRHVLPFVLPDGKRVLFSDVSVRNSTDRRLMVQAMEKRTSRVVLASASDGRVVSSGVLLFMRLATLMIAPFDVARAQMTGEPVAVMTGVMQRGYTARVGANSSAGMFAVSSLGALAVVRGPIVGTDTDRHLTWVTLAGLVSSGEPTSNPPEGARGGLRISPDGARAIVMTAPVMHGEAWIADFVRDTWAVCVGCDTDRIPVWSPDGRQLLVSRGGTLVIHTVDGSAPDRVVVRESDRDLYPNVWLADGRIVYLSAVDNSRGEMRVLEPGATVSRVMIPLGRARDAAVSHNGRWLAYTSFETTPRTVVVQAFPGPGSRTQISAGSGSNPVWSPDDKTLYYLHNNARDDRSGSSVVAVAVAAGNPLQLGRPRRLFARPDYQGCTPSRCYDLTPDGRRFLLRDRISAARRSVTRIDVIQNWATTLPR